MLKINIHYSFLFLILIGLFAGRIVEILIFILIILLHELSHAITALLLGKKVKKITITMIGGVVEIKGHYSTFLKEFLINISGILMNIFLLIIAKNIKDMYYQKLIVDFNRLMILINVLPIYPLDGFRLIDDIVYSYYSSYKAMKIINLMSLIFSFLFLLIGIYEKSGGLIMIAFFLILKNLGLKFRQETRFIQKEVSYYQNKLLTN